MNFDPKIQMITWTTPHPHHFFPNSLSPLNLRFCIWLFKRYILLTRHKDESQKLKATWLSYSKDKVLFFTSLAANRIKDFLCIIGIVYVVRCLMICQSGVSCFSQQSKVDIIPGNHFTRLLHK